MFTNNKGIGGCKHYRSARKTRLVRIDSRINGGRREQSELAMNCAKSMVTRVSRKNGLLILFRIKLDEVGDKVNE